VEAREIGGSAALVVASFPAGRGGEGEVWLRRRPLLRVTGLALYMEQRFVPSSAARAAVVEPASALEVVAVASLLGVLLRRLADGWIRRLVRL
jgi:hypothetical protein